MKRYLFCAIASTIGGASVAHAETSTTISLNAHVDTFCRITPPASDQIVVLDGRAIIGQVREICNTPDGYDVTAHFTNLQSGKLDFGEGTIALQNGSATRSSAVPAVAIRTWSLADATLIAATAPVTMQVTIAPRG